jgi:hypothetical protein
MCPDSTEGGTRRVQIVREGGGGGVEEARAREGDAAIEPRDARPRGLSGCNGSKGPWLHGPLEPLEPFGRHCEEPPAAEGGTVGGGSRGKGREGGGAAPKPLRRAVQ